MSFRPKTTGASASLRSPDLGAGCNSATWHGVATGRGAFCRMVLDGLNGEVLWCSLGKRDKQHQNWGEYGWMGEYI